MAHSNIPNSTLDRLIDRISEVCPLPASVQRVIALTNRDDVEVREIVQALAGDPALATEVLRVANSAAFGHSRTISDLGHAVMTIGFRELNNMASAMALLAAFRSKEELSLHLHDYGLLAGALGQRIGKEIPRFDVGRAFLCGLLSEVGAMACLAVDGTGYRQIWQQVFDGWDGASLDPWTRRAELEAARYGAASHVVGARLLRRNLLPEPIAVAVETSLESAPEELDDLSKITAFARVVSLIAVRAGASQGASVLDCAAPAIAQRLSFLAVPPERLGPLCLEAASAAARWLRALR